MRKVIHSISELTLLILMGMLLIFIGSKLVDGQYKELLTLADLNA